jgi:hypothetical protein
MVEDFEDIEGLGTEFEKKDFEKESEVDDKYLREYLRKKGGKLSCQPISYL